MTCVILPGSQVLSEKIAPWSGDWVRDRCTNLPKLFFFFLLSSCTNKKQKTSETCSSNALEMSFFIWHLCLSSYDLLRISLRGSHVARLCLPVPTRRRALCCGAVNSKWCISAPLSLSLGKSSLALTDWLFSAQRRDTKDFKNLKNLRFQSDDFTAVIFLVKKKTTKTSKYGVNFECLIHNYNFFLP